jgi:hypothetical protein
MAGVLEENLMTYESRVLRTPPKVDSLLLNNHPFAIATSYSSRAYQDVYAYIYEAGGVFNKDETARRRLSAFSSNTIQASITNNDKECSLLFAHPEGIFQQDISHDGLPIMSTNDFDQLCLDQLNNRKDILLQHPARKRQYNIEDSCNVLNYTARAMRLTRGRLQKQDDWEEWKQSEYLQLDQYEEQGKFGAPIDPKTDDPIFYLVWTYTVKQADGRKKARCVCDGSTRSGQVQVLDETYANCVDHTSARLFYAVAAGENLKIYGADVSNAFAEAPPPKQGFYIKPDKAFHD